jgi:putative membrane protein
MESQPLGSRRPDRALFWLYLCHSFAGFVFAPFLFIYLYFHFHTLRYEFDAKGIRQSYGILFHKEVFLTYGRIQDIHLTRGLLQRWLGIATVEIQTASGSSGAQISVEGMKDYEAIRDFLYARMHGAHEGGDEAQAGESTRLLGQIRDELKRARVAVEGGQRERGPGDV